MDLLSTIQKPIEQDIIKFNDYYRAQFKSDVKLLNETLAYMGQSIGKMMRPMLVMLVAKSIGEVDEKTFAAASAMELLHTASLVHDDVIDASDMRRGNPSLNVVFNNNIAVLTGDFLFSQALNNAAMTGDVRVVRELSNLGKALSRGEMLQVELRKDGTYSEENYIDVILSKTASLFVCSCVCAAYLSGALQDVVDGFAKFGKNVGICFQIKDDIFDYYSNDIGKPTGSDMREGKITLPALYVLRNSDNPLLVPVKEKLSSGKDLNEEEISALIEISKNEGGVEYAESQIEKYRTLAVEALPQTIPADLRSAFEAYIDYTISRSK